MKLLMSIITKILKSIAHFFVIFVQRTKKKPFDSQKGLKIHKSKCHKECVTAMNNEDVKNNIGRKNQDEKCSNQQQERTACPFSPNRTFVNKNRLKSHLDKKHSETSTFVDIPEFHDRISKCKSDLKRIMAPR